MQDRTAGVAGLVVTLAMAAVSYAAPPEGHEQVVSGPLAVPPVVELGPDTWRPPEADETKLDWILLKSGEWIRGTLDKVADDTVYFDSKEFDDVEIDWVDIVEIRSPKLNTYRFQPPGIEEDVVVIGTAGLVAGKLRIETGDGVREFDATDLVNMIAGGVRERDYWSFEASFGLSARSGNSAQADVTTFAKIQRQTALTRGDLQYRGSFSSVNGSKTANSHSASFQLDTYLTRRLFLVAPTADAFRDTFQNIALRTTLGVGLGYDAIKRSWIDWRVGSGVAYQNTDFATVQAGKDSVSKDVAVMLSTNLELDPTKKIDWDTSYKIQLVVTDFNNTNHNLTTVISIEVWGPLDLDITAVWDRVLKPPEGSNGVRPKSDDIRLTVGLGIDF